MRPAVLFACCVSMTGCYSLGNGAPPPDKNFYFPVGLAVSPGGNVLYVANSDFDLQWNGGTLQSYDLHLIRRHSVWTIEDPTNPNLPLVRPADPAGSCPGNPPLYAGDGSGVRQPLGQTCAPPVDSTIYVRDSAVIGAFATDLQIARSNTRLFAPVRGDASLTWADIAPDDPTVAPPEGRTAAYAPFVIDCGVRDANRCDDAHHAGNNPNEPGNTRQLTMPGEPFGMAQSEDGETLAITHLNDTETSLFSTGFDPRFPKTPALQFVVGGLPTSGSGIVAVPHDPQAFADCVAQPGSCASAPRPSFLETNRTSAELDLLRYYADQGTSAPGFAESAPYLMREASFPLTVNSGGTDSRGIVIDSTPRLRCKSKIRPPDPSATPPRTQADVDAETVACARTPNRVFVANRTPDSLLIGEIGAAPGDGTYDPDRLSIFASVPLSLGAADVYLAPIVDVDGAYALRVFVVCFDAARVYVYDPDAGSVEAIIATGQGPAAMAFDPFVPDDVAARKSVGVDPREPAMDLKRYRFAYVASFTNSFVQVIDLDNSRADKSTFERVVYTLGNPTIPVGSQ